MQQKKILPESIKAIVGLGNPGQKYEHTRHNIGFQVIDAFAHKYNIEWQEKDLMCVGQLQTNDKLVLLIKPRTFMNASGKVIPFLLKKGIKPANILVIHDELELPFGKIKVRFGGSARGHNGVRSIIDVIGKDFARLSFGVSRPDDGDVAAYVLEPFNQSANELEYAIASAVNALTSVIAH